MEIKERIEKVLIHYADNTDERSAGLAFPSKEDLIYEDGHRAGYAYAVACITTAIRKALGDS